MDLKTEIVTLVVRVLKDKTNLIDTPDSFSEFFTVLQTGKTHEQRTAESLIMASDKLVDMTKKTVTNRKFKKIVKNV